MFGAWVQLQPRSRLHASYGNILIIFRFNESSYVRNIGDLATLLARRLGTLHPSGSFRTFFLHTGPAGHVVPTAARYERNAISQLFEILP
jgi:hypothetical protein